MAEKPLQTGPAEFCCYFNDSDCKVQWQWSDTKVIWVYGIERSLNWYTVSFALIRPHLWGIGFSALPLCLGVYNEEIWGIYWDE